MRHFLALLLAVVVFVAALPANASAERRTALVIGNGAYKTTPLRNPTNDAQDMADALRGMGFDVTLKLNATNREMEEAVRAFGVKLKDGGLGLFYFAGHGVQVAGENYLLPVDTKVEAEADVKFGALNAGMTLARMEDAGNDMNIVILDACRTNPFARSFRTAEQGLARMDAPKGSLIAYATAPGRVAADGGGNGRNGIYTGFLLRYMRAPGLKVEEALKRVRADVVRATADKQVPWESSSLIGDFYFMPPQGQTLSANALPVQALAELPQPVKHVQPANTAQPELGAESEDLYIIGSIAYFKGDYAEAVKWFRKGAEHGDRSSQFGLGLAYGLGKGVEQNDAEAVKWYHKAAEQGDAGGQTLLAERYYNGKGVDQNFVEAVKWYRKAAEKGGAVAQANLGGMYAKGQGIAQNYAEAAKWYQKAAEQGNAQAQFGLGLMYHFGQGVAQNHADAAKWYRKAADLGNGAAQSNLGAMYARGQGLAQNYAEAVQWYRKAAEQGDAVAQANLGYMYLKGRGVALNFVQAYLWCSLGAAQGATGAAESRDVAASKMTPAQIAEAQKLASQWQAKKP